MQALGLIETKGLIAAIECADAMLKAADVTLIEKTYVGGGLVNIAITGDVGAVKAAVDAGEAAVTNIGANLLISHHVIARPDIEIDKLIGKQKELSVKDEEITNLNEEKLNEKKEDISVNLLNKEVVSNEAINKMVSEVGVTKTIKFLENLKVVELRNLAREFEGFGITGRNISKANKGKLIAEFTKFYKTKR